VLQAIEAKEGLPLKPTGRTSASTTFQSFFGFYERLAGTTVGSAASGLGVRVSSA
jgi:preprotein translocase subunit SecA